MIYDTIVANATSLTPSGIGIIRVSGEDSINIVNKLFISNKNKSLNKVKSHTINYGNIVDYINNNYIDEVLVTVMKAPNTYTKENVVEINSHGGIIVMQKIMKLILNEGARLADPGEFTKRAFLNGRIDLSQAEAVIDIINSKTELALQSSVTQLKGTLSIKIKDIKNSVLELIAHIEASIDYPEYDIDELTNNNILDKVKNIISDLNKLIMSYDNGKIISEGIKTVIVGKPNVGKSSLLNALLNEQRAIVTDIPGTTRDVLEESININGVPLRLIDTAGIRETEDVVEKIGVNKTIEKISDADLIIFIIDASTKLTEEDYKIFDMITDNKAIILLNKIDLEQKVSSNQLRKVFNNLTVIPISVTNLRNIDKLENEIKDMFMVGDINFNDNVYITNVRHKVALENAVKSLNEVIMGINNNMTVDFVVIDLKNAYDFICELTGELVNEDIISQIFSQFCLGK